MISRDTAEFTRDSSLAEHKVYVNPDPKLHKFEKPRELVRALNAVKIQKIHAKPFVADLTGHVDTPQVFSLHPSSMRYLVSASCDGEIRVWDVANRYIRFIV